ncbi:MAG: NADH-quinone oxidoreductase subunit C [Flavobacteriales bacterium]|jgi:NADH-quinone oxidoreductase subunit C|nr:NADH-quinone oxidoreductase subunit C [Flavobacteriales bacterium]
MSHQELQDKLTEFDLGLEFSEEPSQYLTLNVSKENLHFLMKKLKSDIDLSFDYAFCITGMDWGETLGVIYHLESTVHRHNLVVKVQTEDRENPTLDSVHDIWATAEFHELEVYDFFGIKFNNHPKLRRLFLTPEWSGYPLRKDYVDTANMIIK